MLNLLIQDTTAVSGIAAFDLQSHRGAEMIESFSELQMSQRQIIVRRCPFGPHNCGGGAGPPKMANRLEFGLPDS